MTFRTTNRRAFTLVELLVVISIIGLMSTIAVISLGSAKVNARNTQRKANLVQISKALELYYTDNGAYPSTGGVGNWRGACAVGTSLPDSGAGAWIPNFTAYVAQLPRDPLTNLPNPSSPNQPGCNLPANTCYLYTSNGTDYKLLAHCIPEGPMSATDAFYASNRPTWAWQVNSSGAAGW